MGSIGNFSDEFWNSEECDFSGWDIIHQRVKDGNKITHNYIDLLKQVTSAMEMFGRTLLKAAKGSSLPEMEHGKLKNALQTARVSVEAWGQDTLDAANALSGQINQLSQHLGQAKDTRKRTGDVVKTKQNQLQDALRKAKQAKKNAQIKYKEKKNSESQRFFIASKSDAKPKELEKATLAEKKAEDALADAEEQHRECVFKHNDILEEWQNTTHTSLNTLQDVEEARVKVIRDSMWSVANVCSMLAVHVDQHQENMRIALLSVDVGQELSSWIVLHKISQSPPLPMVYTSMEKTSQLTTPISTPATSKRSTITEPDDDNSSWESSMPSEPLHNATVIFEFSARSESEISLLVGETVSVLDNSNAEWIFIQNSSGGVGFVPAGFLRALPH